MLGASVLMLMEGRMSDVLVLLNSDMDAQGRSMSDVAADERDVQRSYT